MKTCFCSLFFFFFAIILRRKKTCFSSYQKLSGFICCSLLLYLLFSIVSKNPQTFLMGKELDKKHRIRTGLIQKDIFLSLDVKAMTLFVNNDTWMRWMDVQYVTTAQKISIIFSDSLRDKSHRHTLCLSSSKDNRSYWIFNFCIWNP